jgi:hypothetical protein
MSLRIETVNGRHLVRGGILPKDRVRVGQIWAPADGGLSTVEVQAVDSECSEVTYQYLERPDLSPRSKDNFNFQCRYCLVVTTPSIPEELM